MIITGDLHGDPVRFSKRSMQQHPMKDDEIVVICGDFGLPWVDDKSDKYWLDWLSKKRKPSFLLTEITKISHCSIAFPSRNGTAAECMSCGPTCCTLCAGKSLRLMACECWHLVVPLPMIRRLESLIFPGGQRRFLMLPTLKMLAKTLVRSAGKLTSLLLTPRLAVLSNY